MARELWYRALREEYGIVIEIPEGTIHPITIEKRLQEARAEARDITLNALVLRLSADHKAFIIQRKQQEALP